jgi:hypothetical protein
MHALQLAFLQAYFGQRVRRRKTHLYMVDLCVHTFFRGRRHANVCNRVVLALGVLVLGALSLHTSGQFLCHFQHFEAAYLAVVLWLCIYQTKGIS